MTQARILPILLRRKRTLLISGVAMACVAFAVSRTLPLQYYGEGELILESRASPDSPTGASPSLLNDVSTQVDVLQSGGLIRQVIHDLDLINSPDLKPSFRLPAALLDYLDSLRESAMGLWHSIGGGHRQDGSLDRLVVYIQKHLKIEAKEKSSAISVRYEAGSPTVAAAVANAIMTNYLSTVGATRNATMANTEEWVSRQMAANQQQLLAAEHRVTEFVQSHNMSEVQGSLTAAIQLSKDQAQLSLAREELARRQAALDTAKGGLIAGTEETLGSRSVQKLKEAATGHPADQPVA